MSFAAHAPFPGCLEGGDAEQVSQQDFKDAFASTVVLRGGWGWGRWAEGGWGWYGVGVGQEGRSLTPRDRSCYDFRQWDSGEEGIATVDW